MNPTSTVSATYAQVSHLHISGGIEIRTPSKATVDSRVYQCGKVKVSGGAFLTGESDAVANVLENPDIRGVFTLKVCPSRHPNVFIIMMC